jgi:hypothetical protein
VVTDNDVALVDRLWRELEEHRWEEAVTLSGQLAARLNGDGDRKAARWFGEVLLSTADQLAWTGGTAWRVTRLVVALHTQALLDRGMAMPRRRVLQPARSIRSRPRWTTSVDAELRYDRMKQALWLFDCLIARFDGELDPEARRLVARAQIARIVPLLGLGRYPSVVRAVRSSVAIEPASLVAMIELAEPDEHGSYTHGDRGAALLADHFLADEPLSDETRSKLLAILGDVHQRATGRFARYVDRLGSEWSPFENERRS